MWRDLLTGEAHGEWHHWAATACAHAFLGFGVAAGLALALPELWAILIASSVCALWERRQKLFWDGLLDWTAFTLGALMIVWPVAAWLSVIALALVGALARLSD